MSELRVVIVGAGLAGSVLADALLRRGMDVTVVVDERAGQVKDTGTPARLWPHVGYGTGGTTKYWHNGLIRLPEAVLARWPKKVWQELPGFYELAYPLLGDTTAGEVARVAERLKQAHVALGVPAEVAGEVLYYPAQRRNLWQHLKLDGRVRVVNGRCLPLAKPKGDRIEYVEVMTAQGVRRVDGDVFILCAGGLGTPGLLAKLSAQAGRHYEDHITGFVADVTLRQGFFQLWNHKVPELRATLRQPLVVEGLDGLVAFYLRPAFHLISQAKRGKVTSVLSDLRNKPLDWRTYVKLLARVDDVFDILSFKLGIRVSTRHYTLLMVAEQPPQAGKDITIDEAGVVRDWKLAPAYLDGLEAAVGALVSKLGDVVESWRVLPEWRETFGSSAHHSGTARMAESAAEGVCDTDGKVFGTGNVFVSDGSLLPATGYANTGLSIAAMALRLATHVAAMRVPTRGKAETPEIVDVMVTGAGGFIGQRIIPLLEARGLRVVDAATFRRHEGMRARMVLHLANVHGNPTANARLMRETLLAYGPRVDSWLVAMTLASLSGGGLVDTGRFNAGKKPWVLSPYVAGKLMQEQVLLEALQSGVAKAVVLAHVPMIADVDSPHDLLLRQMKTHGYRAGSEFAAGSGPQLVRLDDLADWMGKVLEAGLPEGGLGRAVLRNPALDKDWGKTLKPYRRLPWVWGGPVQRVKFIVRLGIGLGLGLAWRAGLLEAACRVLWRNGNPPAQRRTFEVGNGPARIEPGDPLLSQQWMGGLEVPVWHKLLNS